MQSTDIREEAKRLVDRMPATTTWEDIMREIYVRQAIEAGMADSHAGKVTPVADVRANFGLSA